VLQRTTAREVAARCGVAPSRVSEWASGHTTPSNHARHALRINYGISEGSWEVPGGVYTSTYRA